MSGKQLVTFAGGSPFYEAALGVPIFVASVVSEPRVGRLLTFSLHKGQLHAADDYSWPIGRLEHSWAAEFTALCGDQLYNLLAQYVGLQQPLEITP